MKKDKQLVDIYKLISNLSNLLFFYYNVNK